MERRKPRQSPGRGITGQSSKGGEDRYSLTLMALPFVPPHPGRDGAAYAATPASVSHSRIFCLGMAPTFIEAIWPPLNSIMVGMPRTP